MIALKAIRTPFTTSELNSFNTARLSNNNSKKISTLCLSKSTDSNSEDPSPKGDTQKQELLARIAQLQTQKVRVSEYLDEKSSYLQQFAEEAEDELGKVGEEALKELDEAGDRIMENIKGKMQEFEEAAEENRLEIEESEIELAALEGQIQEDRNEGLFFKNLGQTTPEKKVEAKEEIKKIKQLTKQSAESKIRKNIYLGLIGVVVIAIADSIISSSSDWRKAAVLGVILAGLTTQVIYEQSILSDTKETEKTKSEEKK